MRPIGGGGGGISIWGYRGGMEKVCRDWVGGLKGIWTG